MRPHTLALNPHMNPHLCASVDDEAMALALHESLNSGGRASRAMRRAGAADSGTGTRSQPAAGYRTRLRNPSRAVAASADSGESSASESEGEGDDEEEEEAEAEAELAEVGCSKPCETTVVVAIVGLISNLNKVGYIGMSCLY